jgi:hypothetical protein
LNGPGTEETGVFSDHVRALGTGEPLDSRQFEELWSALRAALRSELKKRGLWDSRWNDELLPAILDVEQGESVPQVEGAGAAQSVRLSEPDLEIEERQIFRKLVECVLTALDRLEIDEKTSRRPLAVRAHPGLRGHRGGGRVAARPRADRGRR